MATAVSVSGSQEPLLFAASSFETIPLTGANAQHVAHSTTSAPFPAGVHVSS